MTSQACLLDSSNTYKHELTADRININESYILMPFGVVLHFFWFFIKAKYDLFLTAT